MGKGASMKPFQFENWHTWDKQNPFNPGIFLSDENTKTLREFKSTDDAINWLFLNGHKPAARALNAHVKAHA
jgi:hypothetical protein